MRTPRPTLPVADTAPTDPHVTPYDEAHLTTYLRLLDAAKAGAAWEEVARVVLGLNPATDPERARRAHETHLTRALWLSAEGYWGLLRRSP